MLNVKCENFTYDHGEIYVMTYEIHVITYEVYQITM